MIMVRRCAATVFVYAQRRADASVLLLPPADFFTPGEARQLAVRRFLLDLAMPAQRTDQLYSLHGSAEFLLVINPFPCSSS